MAVFAGLSEYSASHVTYGPLVIRRALSITLGRDRPESHRTTSQS